MQVHFAMIEYVYSWLVAFMKDGYQEVQAAPGKGLPLVTLGLCG